MGPVSKFGQTPLSGNRKVKAMQLTQEASGKRKQENKYQQNLKKEEKEEEKNGDFYSLNELEAMLGLETSAPATYQAQVHDLDPPAIAQRPVFLSDGQHEEKEKSSRSQQFPQNAFESDLKAKNTKPSIQNTQIVS